MSVLRPFFSFRLMWLRSSCLLLMLSQLASASPLLWQVDDVSSGGRAYLFGSIHFGVADMYPLPAYVQAAFADSQALVVELDMSTLDPVEAGYVLSVSGRLPDGDSLQAKLTPGQWQQLETVSRDVGIDPGSFQRLKPWLVAVQLTAAQVRRGGYSEVYGIDRHMLELAKARVPVMPVVELESFAEQMRLFDDLDEREEVAFLLQTLNELEYTDESLDAILQAWQQGDSDALEALITGSFHNESGAPVNRRLYQRLFSDRNAAMQVALAQHLQRGERLFVVVGAGHVVGRDGITSRFKDEGYRVLQLHP